MSDQWLIVKYGLYYRPEWAGYTGVRAQAGRYSETEAKAHAAGHADITAVHISEAPEFSSACYSDVALKVVRQQLQEFTDVLADIAKQKLSTEMDEELRESADWKSGHEECVTRARAALQKVLEQ